MNNDLERFVKAQETDYCRALSEIKNGYKCTHWIWYVFPVLRGLGRSSTAQYYGLCGLEEAREYIKHPVLGKRLVEISEALLNLEGLTAEQILGSTDAWKVQCCMTLFNAIAPEIDTFRLVLEHYYDGWQEKRTLRMINSES